MKYYFPFCILIYFLLPWQAYAQTLTVQQTINFGPITFAGNPQVGQITMGTNGTVTYGTSTSGSGVGTPGRVLITGTTGSVVNIRCRNTARISKTGSTNLSIGPVKISMGTGQTYAAATQCAGLTNVLFTHTLTGNTALDTILIGGRIQTNNITVSNGLYKASNTGGQLATVRVILQ